MLCRPASAEAAGQWVVKQWTSSPPPDQPVSPAAASVASTQQPVYGTLRTSSGCRARTGLYPPSLYILSVWLLLLLSLLLFNFRPEELFWIVFSFRNFHLWFANMGSSCGFSRGNIVALFLLLLLEGKVIISSPVTGKGWRSARWSCKLMLNVALVCPNVFENKINALVLTINTEETI